MGFPRLALDIGGANLKAVHSAGLCLTNPFALWKAPSDLADALRRLMARMPAFDLLAVTMTGELCDCFATKRDGVMAILDAVEVAAGSVPIRVWRRDGALVDLPEARNSPLLCAAANWLALVTYVGRFVPHGGGLLIDVGSTTTDIVPLWNGVPIPFVRTDKERLQCGELVYTGVRRTPLCALMGVEGAAEFFATMLDVYLILRAIAENEVDCDTADGRPATRAAALARLARMKCADLESIGEVELVEMARGLAEKQRDHLRNAIQAVLRRLPGKLMGVIVSGSGEFSAREALQGVNVPENAPIISLSSQLGAEASVAACAYALMTIAGERGDDQ